MKQLSWGGSCKETQVKQFRGGGLDVTSQFANLWNASKALHWDRGEELAYVERSSYPWPLIGPFLCKWRTQILTVWLFQRALSWLVGFAGSDWSAKMQMEIQLHSSGRTDRSSAHSWTFDPKTSLIKGQLRPQGQGAGGGQFSLWLFPDMQCVWGTSLNNGC